MRKIARFLAAAVAFSALGLPQLAEAEPRGTLTTNPFGLLLGNVTLELEYAPTDNVSVFLGPWAWLYEGPLIDQLADAEELDYAVGAIFGGRLFLAGRAPEGLWVGPELWVGVAQGDDAFGVSNSSLAFNIGAMGGFTWIVLDFLVIQAGAGVAYIDMRADTDTTEIGQRGWAFVGRTGIGLAF